MLWRSQSVAWDFLHEHVTQKKKMKNIRVTLGYHLVWLFCFFFALQPPPASITQWMHTNHEPIIANFTLLTCYLFGSERIDKFPVRVTCTTVESKTGNYLYNIFWCPRSQTFWWLSIKWLAFCNNKKKKHATSVHGLNKVAMTSFIFFITSRLITDFALKNKNESHFCITLRLIID